MRTEVSSSRNGYGSNIGGCIQLLTVLLAAVSAVGSSPALYERMNRLPTAVLVLSFASLLSISGMAITSSAGAAPRAKEAYSPDGTKVAFEAIREGDLCGRVYVSKADGSGVHAISPLNASASGPSFFPEGNRVVYSQTRCPRPAMAFPASNIFVVNIDGTKRTQLTNGTSYNGEAAVSPDGKTIAFTSTRDGDPAIYKMPVEGGRVEKLTAEVGYEGGLVFSPDGKWIAFRAAHPSTPGEYARFREGLQSQFVPQRLELWIMRVDGSAKRQLTNDCAAFGPYFSADSRHIVYGTNFHSPAGQSSTDLFAANLDNTDVVRLTHTFESPEELRKRKELEQNYFESIRNRERLRESTPFGMLKVLAYLFIAITALFFLLRAASTVLPLLRELLFRVEQFLFLKGAVFLDALRLAKARKKPAPGARPLASIPKRSRQEAVRKP